MTFAIDGNKLLGGGVAAPDGRKTVRRSGPARRILAGALLVASLGAGGALAHDMNAMVAGANPLADSVRDGHARIAPWRQRLAADPGRSLDFLRALDDLAARFGGELPALAGLDRPGRLLEVGGGAGSHAAALARAVPGLEASVLDLPAVETVLRERHPELGFVGDVHL